MADRTDEREEDVNNKDQAEINNHIIKNLPVIVMVHGEPVDNVASAYQHKQCNSGHRNMEHAVIARIS